MSPATSKLAAGTALKPRAFALLKELEANNHRDWYIEHKKELETELREPIERLLETVTAKLSRTALPLRGSKKSMFRMNRDVRFSANKLPYKLTVSGVLTSDGTKKASDGLVYVHCDAEGGFVAGGFYLPETAWLEPVRRRMIEQPKAWTKVLKALDKAGLSLDDEHRLSAMPRGFGHASEHEHVESVKLKSLIVSRPLKQKDWKDDAVVDVTVRLAKDVRPLIEFARAAG